ncbi:hypothetical protein BLA24_25650 [Streptomyces cinnamoneus]|uniref:TPM domain-containing protein n=1 Tax=Streptomyces cinnamoneus TaxID=53446 RepID=A0A2G1XE26_STRCJ|nr:TPM domain-containing protein [Streptomyces cinnamoneus]PHQ49429.1 hypothetical protein BLA24_25650 [Streptomyces cinnamoneus]PPT14921.1 TPM domain-containing protein [Streptomyces cinnamoneus]
MTRLSGGHGPGAPSRALLGALLALCAVLLPAVVAARADTPLDLDASGRITDTVGALGRRRGQVEAALDRLYTHHHVRLYVTYVRDFSGRSGRAWADATADRNGLGPHDVLLAVATHHRQYAVSADKDSGFRKAQIQKVSVTAIAPALAQHDWAGAAVGAAAGYAAVLEGSPVRTPRIRPGSSDPGGDGLVPGDHGVWMPVAGAAGAGLAGLYLCSRHTQSVRLRRSGRGRPVLTTATTEPGLARMVQPLTPLPELEAEAARNLVDTDDAVRTSAEELLFAAIQSGEAATRPFAEAVAYARGELADAFRLRQRLDDAPQEDDGFRRHALDEICSRCTSANRRLDAESEAFDRLRAPRANARAILERAEATARALAPRVDTAEAALAALAPHHAPSALAPVAGHPAEALDRLTFAATALEEARAALAARDASQTALSLRAAEAALAQARTLTLATLRHTHDLTAAAARLRDALTEAAAVPAARAVLAEVRRELARGPCDVPALLRRLDTAALPGRPARAVLAARAEVAAARDFIGTHRGAIGCRARTRLAEAERHLSLGHADRADTLARQARALAEQDVEAYGTPYAPDAPSPARALGGAVVGGIILTGLLPATFGGGATRGRLAG